MLLKEKIQNDLNGAMKAQETGKVSVLRMAKAAIMKFEVSGSAKKEATDEDVLNILAKELKQRKESVEAFRKGGREDLAAKEEAEMQILSGYLPAQMSEEEVRGVVKTVTQELGTTSKADFGKVMGAVMSKVKGKADGKVVNKLVGELLS